MRRMSNLACDAIVFVIYVLILLPAILQAENKSKAYIELESMPQGRFDHVAFEYSGNIYVFLGLHDYQEPPMPDDFMGRNVLRYSINENSWEIYDSIATGSWAAYSCIIGHNIYFAGGHKQAEWIKDSVFSYNINTKELFVLTSLPTPLSRGRGFNYNGSFHILGGHNGYGPITANYVYDTSANSWTGMTELPGGLERYAIVKFDSLVYLLGGRGIGGYPTSNINLIYR